MDFQSWENHLKLNEGFFIAIGFVTTLALVQAIERAKIEEEGANSDWNFFASMLTGRNMGYTSISW